MSLRVLLKPSEIITVAEAAEFMRIDNADDETATISALITGARQWCEKYLQIAIGVQILEVTLDSFPSVIELVYPLVSVTHVKYYDSNKELQTLSADDYFISAKSTPPTIKPDGSFPSPYYMPESVIVTFISGFSPVGDSPLLSPELPDTIKTAMLMLISDMYENRTANVEKVLTANPTLERLLSMYRIGMGM